MTKCLSHRNFVYSEQWSQLYIERYLGSYSFLTYSEYSVDNWWTKGKQIFALSFLFCTVHSIGTKTICVSLTAVFLCLAQGMLHDRCSINIWRMNKTSCGALLICQVLCEGLKLMVYTSWGLLFNWRRKLSIYIRKLKKKTCAIYSCFL